MAANPSVKTGNVELLFRAPKDPDSSNRYDGRNSETTTLPAGYQRSPEHRAFPTATIYEKDVEIPLRDGTMLRGDIFRPEGATHVPAIVPWSPYGKSGRGLFKIENVENDMADSMQVCA